MSPVSATSCVIVVSDLDRSVNFYVDLFDCRVTIRESDVALLLSPDNFQFYLRLADDFAPVQRVEQIGFQQIIWSADSADALAEIERKIRHYYPSTYTNVANGITFVDGIDPDGNRVLVTWPTPAQLPREVIDRRLR